MTEENNSYKSLINEDKKAYKKHLEGEHLTPEHLEALGIVVCRSCGHQLSVDDTDCSECSEPVTRTLTIRTYKSKRERT